MSDSEKTHVLVQDCIISQFGKVSVGFEISESDVDPCTWSYLVRNSMIKSIESIIADADANEESESSNQAATEKTPEQIAMIESVKTLIGKGKLQLKAIVQQSGIAEEVVTPLLTSDNGFQKNQTGWFSLI